MAGSNLRFVGTFALLFVVAAPALGAPPTGGRGERDTEGGRKPRVEEMKNLGVDRNLHSFAGTVLDVNNRPISSVQVSLFIAGEVVGRAVTEANGEYQLRAPYDPSDDVTVLLWFVAPDRMLMPKELVIQESKASAANGLISRCVPRAELTPGHQFRIYLFDMDSRNKELAEAGCLP